MRAGHVRQRGGDQPGGRVLALRDVAARERVRRSPRHRAATARSTRSGATPTSTSTTHGPRPVVPVQPRQARPPRGLRPGGPGDREDGPDDRGRVAAQAAHDEPRVARSSCAAGCSTRAATPPLYALDARLPPRAALRARRSCTSRRGGHRRAPAGGARVPARRARARRLLAARRRRAARMRRARSCSRATTSRRRPRWPPASTTTSATARPRCGRRPRARGELPGQARARRRSSRRIAARADARPSSRSPPSRSGSSPTGIVYRQRRVGRDGEPFELYKLRTMVAGAESMGAGLAVDRGRRAHHPRRRPPAPHVDRRAAQPRQRAARRDVAWSAPARPCRCRSTATRTASAAGWRSSPGLTGWAQVNGPRVAAVERADRARPLVRRARVAAARPQHPVAHRPDRARRRRALQGRDRRMAGPAARPGGLSRAGRPAYGTVSGPLSV